MCEDKKEKNIIYKEDKRQGKLNCTIQNLYTFNVGRVKTTILKIICERYLKNKGHQKSYTYKIITQHSYNGINYTAESSIYQSKEQTDAILKELLDNHTFVSCEKKKEIKKAPLLHTLDSLTIIANKLYKYDASQVLSSAQKLYEAKLISYPRTEDPYITDEGYEKIQKFLSGLAQKYLNVNNFSFPDRKPSCVDSSKITGSHDALIPTGQIGQIENLSEQDKNIYLLILSRCLESFSDDAIYEKGIYNFENKNYLFKTHTSELLQIGWKQYTPKKKQETQDEDTDDDEKQMVLQLPYKSGDFVKIEQKQLKEIESNPPQIYTPATLIEDLSNLSKFLQEENPQLYEQLHSQIDLKALQIGTKATRPEALKEMERRKFISLEKNKYIPTELGMNFYQTIKDMSIVNVAETAKMEFNLKQIAEGKISVFQFYDSVSDYVKNIVNSVFQSENQMDVAQGKSQPKELGICPSCGKGHIIENQKSYGCSDWKNGCKFSIWKEIAGKKLTIKNIEDLVQKGKTGLIKGFKSKTGKEFEAYLVLDEQFKIKFEFEK